MRRREFIGLIGAAAWPLAARAQQSPIPAIGYLYAGSSASSAHLVAAFRQGLSEAGYVDGRNVSIEFRWANNDFDRLPELAADLVRIRVAVIVAPGGTPAGLAAKAATSTVPIIFGVGSDPVQAGLVASLNRPGGNVTGLTYMHAQLATKQLGLLHELLPAAERFAVLANPNNRAIAEPLIKDLRAAASVINRQIEVLYAGDNSEIDLAYVSLVQTSANALLISPDPMFVDRRAQLAALGGRYSVPTIYPFREDAEAGGLMSYGASNTDLFRQVALYAARVLKGEKPVDLPVLRATKFEFIINLKAAKALGLTIPPTLLARADEVIE
jgi:putative tryptophan/tyrosine transport system substrate-binding protein